jgi:hypothetical protein
MAEVKSIKPEILFEIDSFNNSKEAKGAYAIALIVRNLFLMEKNSSYGIKDLGGECSTYIFEFLNTKLINEIKTELMRQLNTYLPDVGVESLDIEKGTGEAAKTVFVTLNFYKPVDDYDSLTLALKEKSSSNEIDVEFLA